MKICVLGLDCAAPEIIFSEPRLKHIRLLMEKGVWGRLQSVIPPITVPAWMCMATSRDPGSLGVYGFRNRSDRSYGGFSFVNSRSIVHPAIWDYLAQQRGARSVLVGIPPGYPPRRNHGVSIGCFLTPDTTVDVFTHPESLKQKIWDLVGDYPVDVKGFRTDDKEWLRREIWEMSRRQWKVVQWLLEQQEWEYFQFVDIGLDRIHHGFWDCFDTKHIKYRPGNAFENVVTEYYCWLDEQIGRVLQRLDRDTVLLVVSDHGARRLEGGFCVNEWLSREGLLALEEFPSRVTPFDRLRIDWRHTRVWSEGGYYARVFFNVQGREPQGVIPASDYEGFRDEIKSRLETLADDSGNPLGSLVFKPEEIYREVRNVAPDLLVHFGGLAWRSIGSVGHGRLHVRENDTGPDACNHSQFGMFILAAPNCPLRGEYQGAGLLDIAPTLLDLAGLAIPEWMQGRSLVAAAGKNRRSQIENRRSKVQEQ